MSRFDVEVEYGGVRFEVRGTCRRVKYTRSPYEQPGIEWEAESVTVGGQEIYHGLREDWQREIDARVERAIRERQV